LKLTGQQRKILREGILGAYPNPDDLAILLSEQMDVQLGAIARGDVYNAKVFSLIQHFEAYGRIKEFIRAVVEDKPKSPYLIAVKSEFASSHKIDFSLESIKTSPKKILILAAHPRQTKQLRVDEELREIKEGLRRAQQREQFVLESAEAVRYRDLRRAVLDNTPNIVHFSGHGAGEDGLVFEDESGQVKLVDAESLAELFKLFADTVECVVLNACYSQVQAEAISQHIPCVVGMGKAIGDRAAIEFAIAFYDAIASGRDYQFAFNYACNAIDLAGIPESDTPKLVRGKTSETPQKIDSSPREETTENRTHPLNPSQRLELRQTLRALIVSDLNDLIDALQVPKGIIPTSSTDAASRVDALWNWADSPTGCGLTILRDTLEAIAHPK
jgi:hypothetical protein